MASLTYCLAAVGAVCLLYITYQLIDFLALHFLTPARPLSRYHRLPSPTSPLPNGNTSPSNAYALITGASAGIGLGIARALLRQGFNLILLGHLPEELGAAAEELRQSATTSTAEASSAANPPVIRTVVMNAQTATPADLQALVDDLAQRDEHVSILVNNVGGSPVSNPPFRYLETYSCQDVDAVLDLNARFMARLSALMIPVLKKSATSVNQRSLIVNLSSGGLIGTPWITMYGATKAFNLSLSIAVARELAMDESTKFVDCLAIVPGDVRSQGNCKGLPASAPESQYFGAVVVKTIDGALARGYKWVSPYWLHDLQLKVLGCLPESRVSVEIGVTIRRKRDAWNTYWASQEKTS